MEQAFLPKTFSLGLESDRIREQTAQNQELATMRGGRLGDACDSASLRQRKRIDIEMTAWNSVMNAMKGKKGVISKVQQSPFIKVSGAESKQVNPAVRIYWPWT